MQPIPLDGLRKQLNAEPGTATGREQVKIEHARSVEEWNALVGRAVRNLDRGRLGNSVEVRGLEIDGAILAEIERMMAAGERIPRPMNMKWAAKLGLGNFAGTSGVRPDFDS